MSNLERRLEKRRGARNCRSGESTSQMLRSIVEVLHAQPQPVINVQPAIEVRTPDVNVGDVNVHIPERKVHLHVEDMEQDTETTKSLLKELLLWVKSPVKPVYDKHGKVIGAKRVAKLDE